MKTSIAVIAIALVYVASLVTADHHTTENVGNTDVITTKRGKSRPSLVVPVGVIDNLLDAQNNTIVVTDSNIVISLNDRVQLAHIIKDVLPNATDTGLPSTVSTEDIFALLTHIKTTPGVLSNAAGIISAAKSGNTAAVAGHVVSLLHAAAPTMPVAAATIAPLPDTIVSKAPVVTSSDTSATPATPMAPMHMRSQMSPPVTSAAAAAAATHT
ncbi:unnamed protein product [Peronospora belbahrii]|uniref:Uncharacterized protein n=1 Tax=Peronospora belbahrii TaxID=622444 RepID=A0AAU9L817_9STRA|nr:unnamed protein product [Peronospora belbahrii]CAH0521258.1 unnamed protein product [Peronospora belbahrii]